MRPYLRAANVGWDGLILDDINQMNFTDAEMDTYRLRPGDLLLGEASGSPGEVGKPALWNGEFPDCAFQNTLLRVRSETMEPRFLLHYFRFMALTGRFVEQSRGVGIHHLGRDRLARWLTPHPSRAEQRRIVDILEEHLTSLEDARRSLDQARVRSVAFWHSTLTRHLDGPVRPLGDVTVHASYGTSTKCTPEGLGPPVARIPNLVAGKIDMTDEKRANDTALDLTPFYLRMGDLLIVRTNGSRDLIGRSAVADRDMDVAFASYLIRFQLDARQALSEWVHLALESLPLRAQIEGLAASSAGQYNLGLKKLTSLKLPLPAVEQQGERLSIIRGSRDSVRRLQASIHDQTRRAGSLRMAVLSAAFLGQLTGRSSDTQLIEDLADQEAAS